MGLEHDLDKGKGTLRTKVAVLLAGLLGFVLVAIVGCAAQSPAPTPTSPAAATLAPTLEVVNTPTPTLEAVATPTPTLEVVNTPTPTLEAVATLPPTPDTAPTGLVYESPQLFRFPGAWNKVPAYETTLFYPAQTSLQYILSADHAGAAGMNAGMSCASCHAGQERRLGEQLVNHPTLEDDPIEGKKPSIDIRVQAAYDDEYLYMRFEWASERPDIVHQLWRYDGEKWSAWGGPKPDAIRRGMPASYEDRVSLLLDDRNVPIADGSQIGFEQVGCWATCHSSMRYMPEAPSSDVVRAHPDLGDQGLRVSDIRKYLLTTRTDDSPAAGWDKVKSEAEIQELFDLGQFLDLWMWRAARSGPIGYGDDSYVLEYRNADQGKSPFANPAEPTYMYDASKLGYNAIHEDQFESMLLQVPLIVGENAVPFDPDAEFQEGDLLPRQVLQTPDGSRAALLSNSRWEDGQWIVEMRRLLDTGNPDDKALQPGQIYNVGIAVFDDMVSNRRHHVSFNKTLGIGIDADIKAEKIAP
jgi:hypothetical protein